MRKQFGRYSVELSNRDKIFYPGISLTKGDVIDYYEKVAEFILPHIRQRPLTMERYPDGIDDEGFIQKNFPDYFPSWFERARVRTREGRQTVPVCRNRASLVYLANQGCIACHVWLSRLDRPQKPDQMIFDLDPPGSDFEPVRQAARDCLALFDELGLTGYLKTTGSRGLHLLLPLRREHSFDEVRDVATDLARVLVRRYPDRYTLEQRKDKRKGRLYLDVQRNAHGQTAVAPYSLRARPGAPVAAPIDRERLDDAGLHARFYTAKNLFRSLAQKKDPWRGLKKSARSLSVVKRDLAQLLKHEEN
jgi:bifunctional non-homologous end joining protein LigD